MLVTHQDTTHFLKCWEIFLEKNPKIAAEIELAIRTKAGLISKKIEENPAVEKTDTDRKN